MRMVLTNPNSVQAAPANTRSGRYFTIRAIVEGSDLRILLDTGATVNFVSEDIVNNDTKFQNKLCTVPSTSVRLGNDTVQVVSTEIKSVDTWIGNTSFKVDYLVMPLPKTLDAILGMDFFIEHDIWLHPATKRLVRLPDKVGSTLEILSFMAEDNEDDGHLQRQALLLDKATRKSTLKPESTQPSSHDKRNPVPHGMAWKSKDGMSEAYKIPTKIMDHLLYLMDENKINNAVLDSVLTHKKLGRLNLKDDFSKDLSGQEFIRTWHGGTHSLLVMEAAYLARTDANSAFLVEPKSSTPTSRPLHRIPTAAWDSKVSFLNMDAALYAARVSDDLEDGLMRTASKGENRKFNISYPDEFHPKKIDATIPCQTDWVDKLVTQKLKRFSCQGKLESYEPLPESCT
eukprot:SAG31_NODE_1506_length_8076_cov_13.880657_2_plen_400_part_00